MKKKTNLRYLLMVTLAIIAILIIVAFKNRELFESKQDKHNHTSAKSTEHAHGIKCEDDHDKDHDAEKKDDHTKKDDHSKCSDEEPQGLKLNTEQQHIAGIKVVAATIGKVAKELHLNGEIKYNAERIARIMPRLPGFVSKINAVTGQQVKQGEILAVLQSQMLGELYSAYNASKELEVLNLSELKIAERLRGTGAMAEVDYLRVKRQYADTRIARRRSEGILKSLNYNPEHTQHDYHDDDLATICTDYEMKSPMSGVIIERDIALGENYAEDNEKPSFIIADLSTLWLELRARQDDLLELTIGQKVSVNIGFGAGLYSGKITYIGPALNQSTRTLTVRVELPNEDGKLKPGIFVGATVHLNGGEEMVVVPREAVQLLDGEMVIFVPDGTGFIPKPVKIGRSNRNFVEILSGLEVGDKFVASGSFALKSTILLEGMDPHAGHGH